MRKYKILICAHPPRLYCVRVRVSCACVQFYFYILNYLKSKC